MAGVRETQKQGTRRKVLEAARDLFNEIGYEESTIRAIAERAGVSVGSVFTTFASKADVLSQVMDDRVEALYAELDRVTRHLRGTTCDRVCSVFAIHYDFECRRVKLFLAHIAASFSPSLDASTIPYGRNSRFKGMLIDLLADGVERGEVRADADLELVLDTLMASYAWNYRLAAQQAADATAMTTIMERQVRLIFDGLKA
ncbi:MAG: TetR/AcrR family transcriptional regulator [Caulobacterales bacterium]|nr:TetR/AcrR family transcriptional regulator [Caulobacterales bacterium]